MKESTGQNGVSGQGDKGRAVAFLSALSIRLIWILVAVWGMTAYVNYRTPQIAADFLHDHIIVADTRGFIENLTALASAGKIDQTEFDRRQQVYFSRIKAVPSDVIVMSGDAVLLHAKYLPWDGPLAGNEKDNSHASAATPAARDGLAAVRNLAKAKGGVD